LAIDLTIISRLLEKIAEIKAALRTHRRKTVYDERLLRMFDDLDALRKVTEEEFRSTGFAKIYCDLGIRLDSLIKASKGSRPSKTRLKSQLKSAESAIRILRTTIESRSTPQGYPRLKQRVDSIQNSVYRDFLQEALRCWRIGSCRACIVVSWCAVEAKIFDIYREKFTIDKIKKLVPEADRREIHVPDDLTTVSDSYLLQGLQRADVLTPTDYRILDKVCNTYRGIAAHAGRRKPIEDTEVSVIVGNMIDFLERTI